MMGHIEGKRRERKKNLGKVEHRFGAARRGWVTEIQTSEKIIRFE